MNHEPPWITKTCFDSHIELKLQYLKSASKKTSGMGGLWSSLSMPWEGRTVAPRRTNLRLFCISKEIHFLQILRDEMMNYSQVWTAFQILRRPAIRSIRRTPWPDSKRICGHVDFRAKQRSQRVIAFMEFLYIYWFFLGEWFCWLPYIIAINSTLFFPPQFPTGSYFLEICTCIRIPWLRRLRNESIVQCQQ